MTFHQNTLDALSAHIAILDESGKIVEVNEAWNRFARANSVKVAGLDVGANYLRVCERSSGKNADEATSVASGIRAVIGGETKEFRLEYPCHSPKEQRWFIVRVTGFEVDGERRIVVAHENITERRKAEENLKISDLALKSVSQGVIITDPHRHILSANAAFTSITGYSNSEILGKNARFLHGPLTDVHTIDAIRLALKNATEFSGEILNYRKDGTTFWNELTITPLWNEHGTLSHFVGVTRDITDRKQSEQLIREAREAAEAANRAKGEFLANMSHEIRTPMNGIIGMTELALDTELTTEQREYLNAVNVSANALLTVINDILDFSKIEAGKLDLDPIEFDLRETLSNTLKPLAIRAHQKGIELTCDVANDIPEILVGDSLRLRQIWVNLLGNALKFTTNGEVGIGVAVESISNDTATLHFKVTDTGIGIPKDKLSRIFEPFSQAVGSTNRRFGGTGLGLTISTQLVQLMGGRLWVESEIGSGSTFHFTVSLGVASAQPDESTLLPAAYLKGLPVLVVDDNATNRHMLEGMLKKWGMKPTLVESGSDALAAIRQSKDSESNFKLMIVDCMMPEMDGFELVEQTQRDNSSSKPIVMMLTSDRLSGDTVRCRNLGIACHLVKPILQADLLNSILNSLGVAIPLTSLSVSNSPVGNAITPVQTGAASLQILLAEDNEINQKLVIRILEKQGHKVSVAGNGNEALQAIERQSFDVVLMDVQMPEMGGFEATACIRAVEQTTGNHLPIIALTANAMKGDRERCLAEGMDGYVSKPIKAKELLEALQAVVTPSSKDDPLAVHPSTKTFNSIELMESVDHDFESLKDLVELFVSTTPSSLKAVRDAILKNDAEGLHRSSHFIKGTLLSFYAPAASNAASALEQIGMEGRMTDAEATFEALEDAVQNLQAELVSFVSHRSEASNEVVAQHKTWRSSFNP